jgi:hypothetical protein
MAIGFRCLFLPVLLLVKAKLIETPSVRLSEPSAGGKLIYMAPRIRFFEPDAP